MAILSLTILTIPAPSLRERSVDVDPKIIGTPDFQAYVDAMTEKMFVADGVGLAAPQVGRNERIIIVNGKQGAQAYINPEITKRSDATAIDEEGCLSVPGVWGLVERAKRVSVTALDRHGRRVERDAKGLDAVIFQHEIDHLNGILFVDKVTEYTRGKEKLSI